MSELSMSIIWKTVFQISSVWKSSAAAGQSRCNVCLGCRAMCVPLIWGPCITHAYHSHNWNHHHHRHCCHPHFRPASAGHWLLKLEGNSKDEVKIFYEGHLLLHRKGHQVLLRKYLTLSFKAPYLIFFIFFHKSDLFSAAAEREIGQDYSEAQKVLAGPRGERKAISL